LALTIYETNKDIAAEAEIAKQWCDALGFAKVKARKMCGYDYFFSDGEGRHGVIEIKNRSVARNHFDTIIISAEKLVNNARMCESYDMNFCLVVRWTDGIGWIRIKNSDLKRFSLSMSERGDRPGDGAELVAHIPTNWFEMLLKPGAEDAAD
jgi:hypothetical protein